MWVDDESKREARKRDIYGHAGKQRQLYSMHLPIKNQKYNKPKIRSFVHWKIKLMPEMQETQDDTNKIKLLRLDEEPAHVELYQQVP